MTPRHAITGLFFAILSLTMLLACAATESTSPPVAETPPPPPIYYVNRSGLALRAGPSTASDQISTLQFNDKVQLLDTSDGWGRVFDLRRNLRGWAALRYLQPSPALRPHYVPRREAPAPKPPAPQPSEPAPVPAPEPSETPTPRVM